MNRKIVIMSRENPEYKGDYPLSEALIKYSKKNPNRYLETYDYICSKYTDNQSLNAYFKDMVKNHRGTKVMADQIRALITETQNGENIEEIINGINTTQQEITLGEIINNIPNFIDDNYSNPLYDQIEKDEDEIYILYWNRLKGEVGNLELLLSLVFKDCGISNDSTNLLYIHDKEWGIDGNELLIYDSEIKAKTNTDILEKLISENFSFAAAFQHAENLGSFFRNILELKWGERQLSDVMAEKENNPKIEDFISLRKEMDQIICPKKGNNSGIKD